VPLAIRKDIGERKASTASFPSPGPGPARARGEAEEKISLRFSASPPRYTVTAVTICSWTNPYELGPPSRFGWPPPTGMALRKKRGISVPVHLGPFSRQHGSGRIPAFTRSRADRFSNCQWTPPPRALCCKMVPQSRSKIRTRIVRRAARLRALNANASASSADFPHTGP